jgi:uncharacterized protein YcgI (DUF1989 family)
MQDLITIPARRGKALRLGAGQCVEVVNTHGEQVVDTWAFSAADATEFMSMEHSRAGMLRIIPQPGDVLLSNRRRPILTLVEDSSGNIHDTMIAACDRWRYEGLGVVGHHDNCQDNLWAAMAELGFVIHETPSPLNLFMNIPVGPGGVVSFEPPVSTPGSGVRLRAEMDVVMAFSACPQDILPINGRACCPTEAHLRLVERQG